MDHSTLYKKTQITEKPRAGDTEWTSIEHGQKNVTQRIEKELGMER